MQSKNEITIEDILAADNLNQALGYLQGKNPDGFGADGVKLGDLPEYFSVNGEHLLQLIRTGNYVPYSVITYEKLTKKGKLRRICSFTSFDRLILRSIYQILERPLTLENSDFSFAYREGTGTLDAAKQALRYVESGSLWVCEIDIHDYFNSIPHNPLMELIAGYIGDSCLLELIQRYIRCTMIIDGDYVPVEKGLLQGNSLSPLFGNLYLNSLDRMLEEQGVQFVRYSDDIKLFTTTYEEGAALSAMVIRFLNDNLELTVSQEKCGIYPIFHRPLLGYTILQTANGYEVQKYRKSQDRISKRWHSSALEYRDSSYHLVGNGILTRKDCTALFENQDGKFYLPSETTDSLNVYSEVMLGSYFFQLAAQRGISVNFFDRFGNFIGSFVPDKQPYRIPVSIAQLDAYRDSSHRLSLAKAFVLAGIHNFKSNIRYYQKKSEATASWHEVLSVIEQNMEIIQAAEDVEAVLTAEAAARKAYYSLFNDILPDDDFYFTVRSRRPPLDPINAMISFGNTVLYNEIAAEIRKTTLDIRFGYLHATGRRSQSLNLDVSEIFKPVIVDRVIFTLINLRMISETEHFCITASDAVYLNAEGKRLYLRQYYKKLNQRVTVDGVPRSYRELMRDEIQKLIRHFRTGEDYKPYRYY